MLRTTLALAALLTTFAGLHADVIATLAGDGKPGYTGDGGPVLAARFNQPFHVAYVGQPGREPGSPRLFIVEQLNHCVRRLNLRTGVITTVAGTGRPGYSGDGGPATRAMLNDPHTVEVDADENLYISDRLNFAIRRVDGKTGIITTIAGTGKKGKSPDGGRATEASLVEPDDAVLDGKGGLGGLLIADVGDWKIRRVDLKTGIISTFAGVGRPSGRPDRSRNGDGGPASEATIIGARAVCVDPEGNTYICEREGNSIRKVDAKGIITTLAGTGVKGYTGDGGEARQATFNGPKAIRWSPRGLYICDTENHAVRRIDLRTNVITTVAGGHKGAGGDGAEAIKAGLDRPHGCLLDPAGNLYIADSGNHRIRVVRTKE
jgi:sugar lactone lactonase YvrE